MFELVELTWGEGTFTQRRNISNRLQ